MFQLSAARPAFSVLVAVSLMIATATPLAAREVEDTDEEPSGPREIWEMPDEILPGDSGSWVIKLQERLTEAGFRPGEADGVFGKATLGAVYAFQKLHNLERDGTFKNEHWDLLDAETALSVHGEAPDRVEVDLAKQILYLVKQDEVEAVLPISSGNGDTFRNASSRSIRARTPEGGYEFYRRVEGWRISYLGALYRPFYFRGGYAIHGSKSVPPYPASHGCVRVELHDMDYLTTELELGMPIFVYGQRTARDDLIPPPVLPAPLAPPVHTTWTTPV